MMTFIYFSRVFFILFITFLLFNFFMWNLIVKDSLNGGDLSRMSYTTKYLTKKNVDNIIEHKFINFNNYNGEAIDLITIGDSFSNSLDIPYQKFISKKNNIKVLNISKLENTKNYLETIYLLLNSGFLEEKKVKYILIESVQRQSIKRFLKNIDVTISTNENIQNLIRNSKIIYSKSSKKRIDFINNLNFNALLYNSLYNFDDNAFFSKAYITNLNKQMFTNSLSKNTLLFYRDDIRNLRFEEVNNILTINKHINDLSLFLKDKKIELIFMPAVDKYNLYYEYLEDKSYPKSNFFEELRTLEKNYQFIDTKQILKEEIDKGVLDIFYSDDTHWSYKASKAIIKKINFN